MDLVVEKFTAKTAAEAGLIETLKRGDLRITGSYELTKDGFLNYQQNNFVFKDKFGNLRCGRFIDMPVEVIRFAALFMGRD